MLSACSSGDSGSADGGAYYEPTLGYDNYDGAAGGAAADSYDYDTPQATVNNNYVPQGNNNSGFLQHADAADGITVDGGVAGLEANADDTYPTEEDSDGWTWTETKGYSYQEYFNTEEYSKITESGYKSVAANPLSTFSVDVDTASYANVRRMIEYGDYVNPEAVRIEEFINYFDYSYPQPTTDDPFSVTTELSDCPWNSETKLLLVGLKAEEIKREEREPLNLVFLIDVSGSMFSEDKLPLVQKAFTMLTDTLTEDDRISIVTYAGEE
ncbi:MAG: von Willebrand factor type A domain-containing protein, partial [Oscillospiraceae bacterium]|nr:von Willebrand factor type A domain-containing protein [Oscillospiraceae bacterium]